MSDFLLYLVPAVPLLFYLTRGQKWFFLDPIHTFWLAYFHFGFVQPLLERENWIDYFGEETFNKALLMFLVLGGAVIAGHRSLQGVRLAWRLPVVREEESSLRIFRVGIVMTILGLLGYALVIQTSGGWQVWSSSPRNKTNFDVSAYIYVLPRLYMLGLLILLCHVYAERKIGQRIAVTALALVHTVWMIYSGTREGSLLMLIILLGAVYGTWRRNPSFLALSGVIMATIFLFAFIPTYRGQFHNLSFDTKDQTWGEIYKQSLDFYATPDEGETNLWAEFGMVLSAAYYIPNSLNYDYGRMLLEPFTRVIPRFAWPDKSYPEGEAWDRFHRETGVSSVENLAGLLSGPSPSMVGKYFYIFGWPGLLLGGFISGVLLRAVWEYVLRHDHLQQMGAVLMIAVSGLGAMEMTHPGGWSVNFWLPTVGLPLFFMLRFVCPKTVAASAASGAVWAGRHA